MPKAPPPELAATPTVSLHGAVDEGMLSVAGLIQVPIPAGPHPQ